MKEIKFELAQDKLILKEDSMAGDYIDVQEVINTISPIIEYKYKSMVESLYIDYQKSLIEKDREINKLKDDLDELRKQKELFNHHD